MTEGRAVARSGLQKGGKDFLVIGAGPIGFAVIRVAAAAGGSVRVQEVSETSRAFAERFGVLTLAEPDDRFADLVFDATGNPRRWKRGHGR
jgi:threonine dehydrogenase-like Zn-dependent dehydrogenase